MADTLDGLIISEILADNPANGGFDTDGDGTVNKSDEFIEIQNVTGSAISLDGYEIWSEKNGLLYSFGPGDAVAPGGTATVVGEYTGTPPEGYYDAGFGEGVNWLHDGESAHSDTIFLVNAATGDYVLLSYGDPPVAPTLPAGFPGTSQIGPGESITSNAPNGVAFARNANGDFVETSPTPGQAGTPCYAPGTLIDTAEGPCAVERLCPGDRVLTLDRGFRPVRWVRSGEAPLEATGKGRSPVLIRAGALGPVRPGADLVLSPQHRVLVGGSSQLTQVFEAEVLVKAKSLVGLPGIGHLTDGRRVRWIHFACDRHEVVRANGCWSESLLLGPMVLRNMSIPERRVLRRIYGAATEPGSALNGPRARPCLKVSEVRRFLARSDLLAERAPYSSHPDHGQGFSSLAIP